MPSQRLLILIAHAPSTNTKKLSDAILKGAKNKDISNVHIKSIAPLDVRSEDLISADAVIIGTTENLGYMAGLIKDVFDRCYYDCLEKTQGLPFSFYVRAGHDGTGTRRAIESITTGLRWRLVQPPLICQGEFSDEYTAQCEEMGMTMAASLEAGII